MKKRTIILIILIIGVIASLVIPMSRALFKNKATSNANLLSAVWNVSLNQTGIDNSISVVSGLNSQTYTLKVRSNSEVDAKYSIVIGNISNGVEVSLDGVNYQTPTNGTVTFTNAGTILYSSANKENTHTIYFRATSGAELVSNRRLTVDVIMEQIL